MTDPGVHDADPGVHDADPSVHDADLAVHDGPIRAFTMDRFSQRAQRPAARRSRPGRAARPRHGLTCVVTVEGAVRCWGYRVHGHPFAMEDPECIHCTDGPHCCIGDDELPQDVGDVELGGVAVQVAAGRNSACAVFAGGAALCWGQGRTGRLGNVPGSCAGLGIEPGPCWIGDDEAPAAAGLIDGGGEVVRIAVYDAFTCATLASGGIRCWGSGEFGLAGANESACCIGDDEPPAAAAELAVFDP